MIKIFERVIRERATQYLKEGDFPLSFLKFSTVTSGKTLNDKVIFLVFKNNAGVPFLCLKTVRVYKARDVILKNYSNLKDLNALMGETPSPSMFAKAIHLHDDGESIFSIETVCPGRRPVLDKKSLGFVVAEYSGFQEDLARRSPTQLFPGEQFAREILNDSGLGRSDQEEVLEFADSLAVAKPMVPRIIQHGDLTEDNILIGNGVLHIIDYDFVGITTLPGFDLFGLFKRYDRSKTKELFREYMPAYFSRVGAEVGESQYEYLSFLYY
ncbi:MAG: hypothetical protein COV10_02040, partial [Candidatus Vogelbacteria bacterium CG10_big_fil_rev_8_21_14_0_10_51_16]